MSKVKAGRIIQEGILHLKKVCQELGLGDHRECGKRIDKLFSDICAALDKEVSNEGIGDRLAHCYPKILNAFVSEQHREKAIYIINRLTCFSILQEQKLTLRDSLAQSHKNGLIRILASYLFLKLFGDDMMTYLTKYDRTVTYHPDYNFITKRGDNPAEHLDYMGSFYTYKPAGDLLNPISNYPLKAEAELIAAEIDFGNQALIDLISDIIHQQKSECFIHDSIVSGIVMSRNRVLLHDLIQLLINADTDDGVQQCICRNMGLGTLEAQTEIFKAICDHDLIRFHSVRQLLFAQAGFNANNETIMRVSDSLFELMKNVVFDEWQCYELLQTNHQRWIKLGIWGLAIRNRQNMLKAFERIVYVGSREQVFASILSPSLLDEETKMHYAKYVLKHYAEDADVMNVWIPYFIYTCHQLFKDTFYVYGELGTEMHLAGLGNMRLMLSPKKFDLKPFPLAPYFESEMEARDCYDKLKVVLEIIPTEVIQPNLIEWDDEAIHEMTLTVLKRMYWIAWMLQDAALLSELLPRYSEMGEDQPAYLMMSIWNPVTRAQRNALLEAAFKGNRREMGVAFTIINYRLTSFDDEDYRTMREYFRLKSARKGDNLYLMFLDAPQEILLETIQYLLQSKKDLRMAGLELVTRLMNDEKRKLAFEKAKCFVAQLKKITPEEQSTVDKILQLPTI